EMAALRTSYGTTNRASFEVFESSNYQLKVTTDQGDCASAKPTPVAVDPNMPFIWPRFSPSGARLAYMTTVYSGDTNNPVEIPSLITVGADGNNPFTARIQSAVVGGDPKIWFAPASWYQVSSVDYLFWVENHAYPADSKTHRKIASNPQNTH